MNREEFIRMIPLHPDWQGPLDVLLATVREEARRRMLEDAMVKLNNTSTHWGHTACTFLSKEFTPPRTLDDVLADIDVLAERVSSDNEWLRLTKIARTAVEGLKEYNKAQSFRHTVLDQTIRKLTEIK